MFCVVVKALHVNTLFNTVFRKSNDRRYMQMLHLQGTVGIVGLLFGIVCQTFTIGLCWNTIFDQDSAAHFLWVAASALLRSC